MFFKYSTVPFAILAFTALASATRAAAIKFEPDSQSNTMVTREVNDNGTQALNQDKNFRGYGEGLIGGRDLQCMPSKGSPLYEHAKLAAKFLLSREPGACKMGNDDKCIVLGCYKTACIDMCSIERSGRAAALPCKLLGDYALEVIEKPECLMVWDDNLDHGPARVGGKMVITYGKGAEAVPIDINVYWNPKI